MGFSGVGGEPGAGVEHGALVERPDAVGHGVGCAALFRGLLELAGYRLHFRVEVVEEVEHEGFGDHGQLGRAELQASVVREHQMKDDGAQARGKIGDGVDGVLDHADADGDVAEELALDGVVEAGLPGEFADFADVVEQDPGVDEIGQDDGVVRDDALGEAEQADDMLQKAAEPGVVKLARGGSLLVGVADGGVIDEGVEQAAEVRVGERVDDGEQRLPEMGNVGGGGGQQLGAVEFVIGGEAEHFDFELERAVEARDGAADFEDIAAIKGRGDARVGGIPDAGFDLAGAVAEDEAEVGLAGFGGALLTAEDEKDAVEGLIFRLRGKIGDGDALHGRTA